MANGRKVIGIDCDDTLRPTHEGFSDVLDFQSAAHGIPTLSPDWYWNATPPEQNETLRLLLINAMNAMADVEPLPNCVEVVGELAEGSDLSIITGRPIETKPALNFWVHKYFGGVFKQTMYTDRFNVDKRKFPPKGEVCRMIGASALIDDTGGQGLDPAVRHLVFGNYAWTPQPDKLAPNEVLTPDWKAVRGHLLGGAVIETIQRRRL